MSKNTEKLKTIGWREWGLLPDLNISRIKMKIDTGAKTSSLHATEIKIIHKSDGEYASFKIDPEQDDPSYIIECESKIIDYREVKSSNGSVELRPVIITGLELHNENFPIEVTLTNRDEMGFKMLLGRESLKNKFLVDASSSFLSKAITNIKEDI